jgi:hypothetical protein
VQHISGCTIRNNGNTGLTATSGSSGIFASVTVSRLHLQPACSGPDPGRLARALQLGLSYKHCLARLLRPRGLTSTTCACMLQVDGSEFLVDCPAGSETCNLLVVLPGVNTGSSLSLSGGLLQPATHATHATHATCGCLMPTRSRPQAVLKRAAECGLHLTAMLAPALQVGLATGGSRWRR